MTTLDEYSEWDKRVLGPDAKLVRDDADAMRDELLAELAKWQEEARSYCQSASYHRQKREQAEAENERLRGIMGICSGPCHSYTAERYIVKVHEVVAELAALKARRCDTCKRWRTFQQFDKNEQLASGCPVSFLSYWDWARGRGADDYPPIDFCCSRWAARTEGGE
jgi:hypothetical protein